MGLSLRDREHHTYGEYLTWPEDTRYELIDGQAYAMSPAPLRVHQEVVGELYRQIANALDRQPCRVYAAPFDIRLPKANEADDEVDTVVQPDIVVICDSKKLDRRGCRGAPDWIIEVLSPETAAHDALVKREIYERAGVREYWLVHPTDHVVTVYRLTESGYGKPYLQEFTGTLAPDALPAVALDLDRVARRLEHG